MIPVGVIAGSAVGKNNLLVNTPTAGILAATYGGLNAYGNTPSGNPWYVAVTGLRTSGGTYLSGKTLQIQFRLNNGSGALIGWYNITNATMVTDASGNAQRNFWFYPGEGHTPTDSTTYTNTNNNASAQGNFILYKDTPSEGIPQANETRWRVVFAGDDTNNALTSAESAIFGWYAPGG